jgi:hypothetical protein
LPEVSLWAGHSESEAIAPKGWPRQLDTRKLYPSKCGFVYAASDSAAAQVNKLIEAAVKEMQENGVKTPSGGLVLVMDRNEKPPFSVEELMIRLARKQDQQKEGQEPQKALESLTEGKKEFEELGLDMNLLLTIAPMPIEPNMLPDLVSGFPQDVDQQIRWCTTIPTESNIRYGMKKLLDAGMKKEKIGIAKRVAMLPLLAFAENKAVGELKKGRGDALCQLMADKQKPLMDEQRRDKGQERKS